PGDVLERRVGAHLELPEELRAEDCKEVVDTDADRGRRHERSADAGEEKQEEYRVLLHVNPAAAILAAASQVWCSMTQARAAVPSSACRDGLFNSATIASANAA